MTDEMHRSDATKLQGMDAAVMTTLMASGLSLTRAPREAGERTPNAKGASAAQGGGYRETRDCQDTFVS